VVAQKSGLKTSNPRKGTETNRLPNNHSAAFWSENL